MRNLAALLVCLGSWLPSSFLQGYEDGAQLPVTGSMIYNALLLNRVDGAESRGLALRFAGRIAFPLARGTYVGVGGGSWVRITRGNCGSTECDAYVGSQSEAIVYQLYAQHYVRGKPFFIRGGTGLAETRTLVPQTRELIAVTRKWRGAVALGGGVDLALTRNVYLTPSLDFTVLPASDTQAQELGSAFAIGLGVTVR